MSQPPKSGQIDLYCKRWKLTKVKTLQSQPPKSGQIDLYKFVNDNKIKLVGDVSTP